MVAYTEQERTHETLVYDASEATGHCAASALPPGQRLTWATPLYKKLDL
jgi:hypothetical protein